MKTIYTIILMIFAFTVNAQVETDLTTFLNQPCNATICDDIQLGVCPGDVNSDGEPFTFTDYQVYYATENVILEYNSLTLRNCRLELRNGANLVDNGIIINEETDCDSENTTEIVFIGGGQRFASVEQMNQTLGINEIQKPDLFNLPIGEKYKVVAMTGQVIYEGLVTENTKNDLKKHKGLNILCVNNYKPIKIVYL